MKQHIVTKSYLKLWCDPRTPAKQEPYIWLISKDGSTKKKKAPLKSFTRSDLYTIDVKSEGKDLSVEIALGKLESQYVRIIRRRISKREMPDSQEHLLLCSFIGAMYARTDPQGEAVARFFSEIDVKVRRLEEIYQSPDAPPAPPAISGRGTPIDSEQTAFLRDNARPFHVQAALEISPLLCGLSLAVLETPGDDFITSDNPCVWFSPSAYRLPPFYRTPNLSMPDIEITMPLTPRFMACLTRSPNYKGFIKMTAKQVDDLNRRTRAYCKEWFVSKDAATKPVWFDLGTARPDAWENRPKPNRTRAPR